MTIMGWGGAEDDLSLLDTAGRFEVDGSSRLREKKLNERIK